MPRTSKTRTARPAPELKLRRKTALTIDGRPLADIREQTPPAVNFIPRDPDPRAPEPAPAAVAALVPVPVAAAPPRLLTKKQVCERVQLSFQAIWRRMREGTFPRGFDMGGKTVWLESEVNAWIAALPRRPLKGDDAEAA